MLPWIIAYLLCLPTPPSVRAAQPPGREPHAGNPVLPGYFGDPSMVQHDGKVFVYATLDPWGDETLGCWESEDFRNWTYRELNWPTRRACRSPTSGGSAVWAPSVIKGADGRFYMYVSVFNEVWAGVADHPLGPWRSLTADKTPLIEREFRPGFHMIDAEAFLDDDGTAWLYWGSGHGWKNGKCWVVKLKPDMHSFDGEVRDVTPRNYFEGPVMVKRHGKYFLMYSQGITVEDSYQVHYAVGDNPVGPFTEAENSPILVTDKTANVISPGHHTVFRRDGRDYILYHRHSIPFDPKFIGRQVCVDELVFTPDGRIEKVTPTHAGPPLARGRLEGRGALPATASSPASASEWTAAGFAVDDNYATHWRPAAAGGRLELDLGGVRDFARQEIRFEYAWKPCRFRIEASDDGIAWRPLADHLAAPVTGSPVVIDASDRARHLRLTLADDMEVKSSAILEWVVFSR